MGKSQREIKINLIFVSGVLLEVIVLTIDRLIIQIPNIILIPLMTLAFILLLVGMYKAKKDNF